MGGREVREGWTQGVREGGTEGEIGWRDSEAGRQGGGREAGSREEGMDGWMDGGREGELCKSRPCSQCAPQTR